MSFKIGDIVNESSPVIYTHSNTNRYIVISERNNIYRVQSIYNCMVYSVPSWKLELDEIFIRKEKLKNYYAIK